MSKKETEKAAGAALHSELYAGVVSVRASAEMLASLDEMARALSKETGISVTRSDMARKILRDAIKKARGAAPAGDRR